MRFHSPTVLLGGSSPEHSALGRRLESPPRWSRARKKRHLGASPGTGGLVTALAPVLEDRGGIWVGWPGLIGEESSEIEPLLASFAQRKGYGLVPVSLTQSEHDLFYLGFANEVLWPLFHDLQSRCTFVRELFSARTAEGDH